MKLSFHTCGLEWYSLEEAVAELAGTGYDGVGPCTGPGTHLDPEAAGASDKERLAMLAADAGISFSILNPWKVGGFAAGIESGETEAFYTRAIDLASEIGAEGVKFLPGSFAGGEAAGWKGMIEVLRKLCRHAEKAGVDLLMHNHENHLIDTANGFELLRLHVGSERLRINIDCGNLAMLLDDPCRAIGDHAADIRHVRVKGIHGRYPFAQQAPAGSPGDIVDWEAVFRTLAGTGFAGFVEIVAYPWFPPDYHRTAYAWARDLAARTGL